jgi:hypothetical protein
MTWSGSVSVDVATSLGTVIESLKLVNVPSDTVFLPGNGDFTQFSMGFWSRLLIRLLVHFLR